MGSEMCIRDSHNIVSEFIEKEGEYINREVDYLSSFNPFKKLED